MARFMVNISRRVADADFQPMTINGEVGLVAYQDGHPPLAMAFEVEGDRVRSVHVIRNPDKLASLDHPVDLV